MAYLHCHTKDCGWSQDDFYSFKFDKRKLFFIGGYNPISKILDSIRSYIKPRMIKWDRHFVNYDAVELQKYTKIKIRFNENNECFSWNWLILEIVKDIKNAKNMRWWSYKSWKKDMDKGKAKCPKCGKVCFDID